MPSLALSDDGFGMGIGHKGAQYSLTEGICDQGINSIRLCGNQAVTCLHNQVKVIFQVENGSATTTMPESALVEGWKRYPDKKRPTLTSARNHRITSQGHGFLQVSTLDGTHEEVYCKFTSAIKHLMLSPARHLERNRDQYWGYTICVNQVFKVNKNQTAENKYSTAPEYCVILGTYANKF